MDGGSTDGSIEIIKKYERWIDYWETGPDDGQANALDRGLRLATGLWFQNVNSDDLLLPDALSTIGLAPAGYDLIATPVHVFNSEGRTWISPNRDICLPDMIRARPLRLKWHQPGVFMRTENIRQVGGFPQDYFLWDYIVTALYIERFGKVIYLAKQLIRFRVHSSAQTALVRMREEGHFAAAKRNLAAKFIMPHNRAFARLEALRTSIHDVLLNESDIHYANTKVLTEAIKYCVQSPMLFFDRVFLACLKKVMLRALKPVFFSKPRS